MGQSQLIPKRRKMYCAGCGHDVIAKLVCGNEVYDNPRYASVKCWKCSACGNYCTTSGATVIPNDFIRSYRRKIHSIIDPIWRSGVMSRGEVYTRMTQITGKDFHGGALKSEDEALKAYEAARRVQFEALTKEANRRQNAFSKNTRRRRGRGHRKNHQQQ